MLRLHPIPSFDSRLPEALGMAISACRSQNRDELVGAFEMIGILYSGVVKFAAAALGRLYYT